MQKVATFDPSAATSGTFTTNLSNGIGKIIIWNESNWILDITFTNGDMDIAPAWTATIFHLNGPAGRITWTQDTQLTGASAPISQVVVVAYRDNETIPGTFPLALVRQVNIGSAVNTVGGAASFIQNDANTAGTSIVESTVSGDGSSAVSLTNDAIFTLGDTSHPGSLTLKGKLSPATTALNSSTYVDSVDWGNGSQIGVFGSAALDLQINANGIIANKINGTQIQHIGSDGVTVDSGSLNINTAGVVFNGTTGTATLYQFMRGTMKMTYVVASSNFTCGATFDMALPTAYATGGRVQTDGPNGGGGTKIFAILSGGVVKNIVSVTGVGASGWVTTSQTGLFFYQLGFFDVAIDTIRLISITSVGSTNTMLCYMEGI